jgi:hypothetical protein
MSFEGNDRRKAPCLQHEEFMKRLDGKVDLIMDRQVAIKTQVETTNGRVSNLEDWKSFTLGGMSVIAAMLIPMFLAWFGSQLK